MLTRSVRIYRGGALRVLAAICMIPAGLFLLGGMRVLFTAPWVVLIGVLFSIPIAVRIWHARLVSGVSVRATPEGVWLGEQLLANDRIEAVFLRDARTVTVVLQDRTRVELEVDQPAEEVVSALGFDRAKRLYRVPLQTVIGPFTKGFSTFVGSMLVLGYASSEYGVGGLLGALVCSVLLTTLVVRWLGAPQVIVGTDGMRLELGLRRRFVSFADIAKVRTAPLSPHLADQNKRLIGASVVVELRDGERVQLDLDGDAEALVRRIEAGRRDFDGPAASVLALARGERTLSDWRRDLEELLARPPGYREAPLGVVELTRELSDASAPADRRIGAALALRSKAPEEVARIRVAADTCADDAVRLALEAVCDDRLDEATLERAERRT